MKILPALTWSLKDGTNSGEVRLSFASSYEESHVYICHCMYYTIYRYQQYIYIYTYIYIYCEFHIYLDPCLPSFSSKVSYRTSIDSAVIRLRSAWVVAWCGLTCSHRRLRTAFCLWCAVSFRCSYELVESCLISWCSVIGENKGLSLCICAARDRDQQLNSYLCDINHIGSGATGSSRGNLCQFWISA